CLVLPDAEPDAVIARLGRAVGYPLIVKPAQEGSSKGIRSNALVDDVFEAIAVAHRLAEDYAQPVLVEQFIDGDEVTVGLVGNPPTVELLGTMRVVPKQEGRFVYSLEIKRDWADGVEYETPARLAEAVQERLDASALQAY